MGEDQVTTVRDNSSSQSNRRKINLHTLSYLLIAAGIIFCLLTVGFSLLSMNDYHNVTEASEKYIEAETSAHDLQSASDFLTEQSRDSVNLKDISYIKAYCNEVTQTMRRERAMKSLSTLVGDSNPEAMAELNSAMSGSTGLTDKEYHAMRLISLAADMPEDELPDLITNYSLPDEELSLSAEEQRLEAFRLVNDQEYADAKGAIDDDIDQALSLIKVSMMSDLNDFRDQFRTSSELLRICIFLSAIDFLAIGFAVIFLLLNPLSQEIQAIKKDRLMPGCRSEELSYLVNAYNELHARNSKVQDTLRDQAEHDALTGLLNRSAFDKLCEYFSEKDIPLTLMVLDLDDFKGINDNYGHHSGDLALQKVSALLKNTFRSDDYIIRYGGDEFIVFMCGAAGSRKKIIRSKLEYINESLGIVSGSEIPAFSISCGIAFSDNGYSSELFRQADSALYETKKNGKGHYTFA